MASSLFWTIFILYLWDVGFDLLQISLFNATATLVSLSLSRFFGKLSDNIGKKPFILSQLFLNKIAFLGFYLAISYQYINFTIFLCFYTLLGFAGAVGGGALIAAVTTALTKQRTGEATGTFLSFSAIGWTLGSFLSGFIADRFGITTILIVSLVLILVAEIVLVVGYSEKYIAKKYSIRKLFAETWSLRIHGDSKRLLLLFLTMALFNFGGSIYNLAFSIKMYLIFGSKTAYGIIGGFCGISNMIAPYMAGKYSDRVSKEKMMLIGLTFRDFFMLYLAVTWDRIATIIFMVTPMWVFINIPMVSLTTEYSDRGHESEIQSLRGIVCGVSSTIGGVVSGFIARIIDLRNNIMAIDIILLVGCIFYFMALIPSYLLRRKIGSNTI